MVKHKSVILVWESSDKPIECWIGNVSEYVYLKLWSLHMNYFGTIEEVSELYDFVYNEEGKTCFEDHGMRLVHHGLPASVSGILIVTGEV